VEGLVGYVRRNFMTPLPVAESFDVFNARLVDACTKRRQAILRSHRTTISERMQADLAAFMKLPPAPYDACDKVNTRVSSLSLVRYKNNERPRRSIKRRLWTIGDLRTVFIGYGDSWKRGWGQPDGASSSRCCG
jgi:hypothetical protein